MSFWGRLKSFFGQNRISPHHIEALERLLLEQDFGAKFTHEVLDAWKNEAASLSEHSEHALKTILRHQLALKLGKVHPVKVLSGDFITLWGVNGVGKTTTAAKLAWHFQKHQGYSVMLAGCDTFRAAATEQLGIWAERLKCDYVQHGMQTDPAAVAFDALKAQQTRGIDVCIADTAGRMHHHQPLQEQSKKIIRVLQKLDPKAPHHRWLVLDANLGQNALSHIEEFDQAIDINGLILTKWDGKAKAGYLLKVMEKEQLPVLYLGTGEKLEDLTIFTDEFYLSSLLDEIIG